MGALPSGLFVVCTSVNRLTRHICYGDRSAYETKIFLATPHQNFSGENGEIMLVRALNQTFPFVVVCLHHLCKTFHIIIPSPRFVNSELSAF
jgi:hypothetical protein